VRQPASVVTGLGPNTGEPLGRHMHVDALTFTSSTATRRRFLEYSAHSNMKEVCLEVGEKSAAVVFEAAIGIAKIPEIQANAILWNMGENCTANSRIIVHASLYEALVSELAKQTAQWVLGDPLNPDTQNRPLVSAENVKKVAGFLKIRKSEGARHVRGGEKGQDLMFQPMVFTDVNRDMKIFQKAIFGPVVAITKAHSDDEAMALALALALAATLYTRDIVKTDKYACKLKTGIVAVNAYFEGEISTPFGGLKASGFGGRDNSIHAHQQSTNTASPKS
jgi:gamma-glutamyl-gamma-aminobutyraldehyde dehydrogenase